MPEITKLTVANEQGQKVTYDIRDESKMFAFGTVADMKASALKVGSFAHTLGYYSENDGGSALYKIRTIANNDVVDESFIIAVGDSSDGLVAELIIKDKINIRQLGAKSQDKQNNKTDIAPYITKYINKLDELENKIALYIPSGVWYSSPLVIHRTHGFDIIGDEQFIRWVNGGTVITSIQDNQDFIFRIGNLSEMVETFTLKNICFSTADYLYNSEHNDFRTDTSLIKNIDQECVRIQGCQFGDTDNLYFQHINGTALSIRTSWEIRYRKLFFRDIDAHNSGVMHFAEYDSSFNSNGVNASSFDNMMFEQTLGDLIVLERHCDVKNCYFGIINFETNKVDRSYVVNTTFNSENIPTYEASSPIHFAVIAGHTSGLGFVANIINALQLNNLSCWYSTIDNQNYCYDKVFNFENCDYSYLDFVVNTIDSLGLNKNAILLSSLSRLDERSQFILNNLNSTVNNGKQFSYDVDNFPYIRHDGHLKQVWGYIYGKLSNSATPAYELINYRTNNRSNFLKSDSEALNELGICAKCTGTQAVISFINNSNKLILVAKIPNGETALLDLSGSESQRVDLVGTGAFNPYEITLNNTRKIGDLINISFRSGNTATSCLIDYIIN